MPFFEIARFAKDAPHRQIAVAGVPSMHLSLQIQTSRDQVLDLGKQGFNANSGCSGLSELEFCVQSGPEASPYSRGLFSSPPLRSKSDPLG